MPYSIKSTIASMASFHTRRIRNKESIDFIFGFSCGGCDTFDFFGYLSDLNWVYFAGIIIIAGLLLFEHILVSLTTLTK